MAAPVVAGVLVWTRYRQAGAFILAVSMCGALVFGVVPSLSRSWHGSYLQDPARGLGSTVSSDCRLAGHHRSVGKYGRLMELSASLACKLSTPEKIPEALIPQDAGLLPPGRSKVALGVLCLPSQRLSCHSGDFAVSLAFVPVMSCSPPLAGGGLYRASLDCAYPGLLLFIVAYVEQCTPVCPWHRPPRLASSSEPVDRLYTRLASHGTACAMVCLCALIQRRPRNTAWRWCCSYGVTSHATSDMAL